MLTKSAKEQNILFIIGIILVLLSAVLSVAFPLGTYTLTLATFGLAHVLTELHYIDNRFHPRLSKTLLQRIIALLLVIATLRFLQVLGLIPTSVSISLELACVTALVTLVTPVLAAKSCKLGIFATLICIALTIGVIFAPSITLLIFAILHNLTPVGFIAERLRGLVRFRALVACTVVFAILPLIILSGIPYNFLSKIGLIAPSLSFIDAGNLESHLQVFVPPQLDGEIAIHAFSAAVFLQCMHYAVVIGILPKWTDSKFSFEMEKYLNFLPWSDKTKFKFLVIALSMLLFIYFNQSFTDARMTYGIFAAVHAWVEIPILLLAL